MKLRYPTTDAWCIAQLKVLNRKYDNWHLNCGEEGTGKSKFSRKVGRRLDYLMRNEEAKVQLVKDGPLVNLSRVWRREFPLPRPFTLDGVVFGQDNLLDLLVGLEMCGVAVGDEIEGSKRLAMYAQRLELLDHVKESRALRHNVFLNFPQFTDFEGTMTKKRIRWWEEHERRGFVVVRERISRTMFDNKGEPYVHTKWPVVGRYPTTGGNDPWERAYDAKKEQRMRDRASRRQGDEEAVEAPRPNRIPPALLDMVLGEVKKP